MYRRQQRDSTELAETRLQGRHFRRGCRRLGPPGDEQDNGQHHPRERKMWATSLLYSPVAFLTRPCSGVRNFDSRPCDKEAQVEDLPPSRG